jgi:hypothetical protein
VKTENFVAGQHVRSARNRIAACSVEHRQPRDLEIVAHPRIRLFGFGSV